jgi:molybdopterin-guanine dinucleotide biosynthesis protein A
VLAGGESARIGTDKAFLKIGGKTLIEQILEKLLRIGDDVIVVTNSPERYNHLGVRLVSDISPGKGALGGIYSGLKASKNEYSFVVACDMPFLNVNLIRYMTLLASGHDVVIPRVNGLLEPLHAIYSKRCIPSIERLLEKDDLKIVRFFSDVRVRYVEKEEINVLDPKHLSFFNINTLEDLEKARKLDDEGKSNRTFRSKDRGFR